MQVVMRTERRERQRAVSWCLDGDFRVTVPDGE